MNRRAFLALTGMLNAAAHLFSKVARADGMERAGRPDAATFYSRADNVDVERGTAELVLDIPPHRIAFQLTGDVSGLSNGDQVNFHASDHDVRIDTVNGIGEPLTTHGRTVPTHGVKLEP